MIYLAMKVVCCFVTKQLRVNIIFPNDYVGVSHLCSIHIL